MKNLVEVNSEQELINRLIEIRLARGFSQTAMAIELNISQQTLCQFEKGRYYIKYGALKEMSKILGLDIVFSQGDVFIKEN